MFLRELTLILLLTAAAVFPPELRAATAATTDGVAVDMDRSSTESLATLDELRALDRQVAQLFRVGGRKLPLQCRIVVSGALPKGELRVEFTPREWTLSFNDRDGDWLADFALRRRLAGVLLLSKLPRAKAPADPDFLPGWIMAGIDARLNGARESESLMRRNRRLPVLRALAIAGTFPEFRRIRLVDPLLLSPAAMGWYRELGRVMLEFGFLQSNSADNALLDYCILAARPDGVEIRNFQSTLGRVFLAGAEKAGMAELTGPEKWEKLSDDDKIECVLREHARRLAFNVFFPQPPELAAAAFAALDPVMLPALNGEGKPTGENTGIPLADFPEKLLDRPDAEELQRNLRGRILALREGNDNLFREQLEELADATMRLPLRKPAAAEASSAAGRFRNAAGRIRADLARRAAVERLLDSVEAENRVPAGFYAGAIREANLPSPILSDREREFLDRVEREWLDD